MKDYQFLHRKYVVPSYANRGVTFVRGDGVYLFDDKKNRYLDLMSNYGASIFGYNNSRINKAIINQLRKLPNLHGSFASDVRAEASEKLVKRCGLNYSRAYWSNSGSEAVEAALKFAVFATGKKKFVAAHNSFHGKTLGALSATGTRKYRKGLMPLLWNFTFVDYNNIGQLKKVVNKGIAAVILEPIQGESGVIVPEKGYLKEVEGVCKFFGCLLIIDEVQTGVGRTGKFLESHAGGVEADIVCLGKGLAGGLSIGATIVTEEVASKIPKYGHSSTLGGNPLACAAVLAALEILNEKMLGKNEEKGNYFMKSIRKIRSNTITDIRGKGLMIGIEVKRDRDIILKSFQKNGILAIPAGEDVVRFLPPYIISKNQIESAVSIFKKVLS